MLDVRTASPARLRAIQAALVITGSALMALGAHVSIPVPWSPVPITGQTFALALVVALLGTRGAVAALLDQDYVSGLFVDDKLGHFPGTLPMSELYLKGKAVTPNPSIVVNFRSYATGCDEPTNCSVEVSDTVLRQGQGMHGSFGRGDTLNFTAAIGPDFKAGYVDPLPVSNADVGMTMAQLMGLRTPAAGGLTGRVMSEALPNGIIPKAVDGTITSKRAANGLRTVVKYQRVLSQRYFDAAGFPGRTVGLDAEGGKQKTAGK